MTVLGIDPGSVAVGYGVVVQQKRKTRLRASGCIRPARELSFEKRLLFIHDAIHDLVHEYAPDAASVEAVFHGANVQTLMKMCHARGTILLALTRAEVPIHEYAPREIKKAVAGNGNASKEQVAYMVQKVFGMEAAESLDESDGIAAALCHASRSLPVVGQVERHAGSSSDPSKAEPSAGTGRSLAERLVAAGADPEAALRAARGSR